MENPDKLTILWTNADVLTAEKMVFMYAGNSMKHSWWKEVEVVIWGATAKLVAENKDIQALVAKTSRAGVRFSACLACTTQLGVTEALRDMGIDVRYYGLPLTELLKNGEHLLSI